MNSSQTISALEGEEAEIVEAMPDMPDLWKSGWRGTLGSFSDTEAERNGGTDDLAFGFSESQAKKIKEAGYTYLEHTSPELV